ncbi:MAG: TlpA family protein disulfide reductase [Acidimicrobiales bacterium]
MTARRLFAATVSAAMLLGGCGSSSSGGSGTFSAQVASYDLSVGRDQRVIAGVLVDGGARIVGFGSMDFAFAYRGTKDRPLDRPRAGPQAGAAFRPIPGQRLSGESGPARVLEGSEGIGVYAADAVRFDAPGVWELTVTGRVGTKALSVKADFEVLERPVVPLPGEAAPRTENLLPGAEGAPVKAIDSRAEPDGRVPDPALHTRTVAAAIASGRPTMVVISTPVYCQSRFCGPITDWVQALADRYGERMHFLHLEVWRDFEAQTVNRAAAEWIFRDPSGDIHEPWVFVIGRDGVIAQRFDNVVSETELQAAVEAVLA